MVANFIRFCVFFSSWRKGGKQAYSLPEKQAQSKSGRAGAGSVDVAGRGYQHLRSFFAAVRLLRVGTFFSLTTLVDFFQLLRF